MNSNRHLTRITAGIAAGALISMGAIGVAQSANAASAKDKSSIGEQAGQERLHGDRGPGGPGGPSRGDHAAPVHSEMVVKLADGSFVTRVAMLGTVSSVSSSSITVKAADDYTASFAVSSETKVAVAGKTSTIAEIKVGDTVGVHGVKSGSTLTAQSIRSGTPAAKPSSS